ncbi:unnamed protein product [Rotaria magnacalcarata]|uniref:Striatin N-terminal domain-containing protein n=1 Tax=Rotaria magnacalcarata TaxID=392030 RepID=A0A816NYJ6_9BILA|nr:unnamed protein product [Rotaria magnacalcarata]CAF1679345.1 unnamed protein product [Rotaria magnacalcarata]CAF2042057.1 unnamed protein product [Rotaria magnacalcarata]CAF2049713.1 unnamed protein product [Rotaria magnacalcarata]CAF2051138.1 unnamed protein product [Rotaria magnacalcarata]
MDGSETQISYQNDSQTTAPIMGTVDTQHPMYTVPGILHFLQHEWTRFEIERQQWETERAELQARIAFLQGERQGQENLKTALVRRIKMLEYALKQERLKYNQLKYGSETAPTEDQKSSSNEGQTSNTAFDEDENKEDPSLAFGGSSVTFKQGRQLLRQYLKEIGYVDTIIDIRSAAVKKLLGIKSETNLNGNNVTNSSSNLNGDAKLMNEPKGVIPNILKNAAIDFNKSLASLAFLKDDQPDEESHDIDTNRSVTKSNNGNATNINHLSSTLDTLNDLDGEEAALHEFDFLTGDAAAAALSINEFKSTEPGSHDWNVDPSRINRLKEEYKRDRHIKPAYQVTTITNSTSASIRNNLFKNNGADDISAEQRPFSEDEQIDSMMFRNSKNFIGENAIEGLDELARVTVSNDNEPHDDTNTNESSEFKRTWNIKYVLRSHLDGIRCATFHPFESVVITGSEDRTLKLWNLEKSALLRKSTTTTTTTQDLEPVYTFRQHTAPVLCTAIHPYGEQFYSGGLDSIIAVWNIPNSEVDPYDAYDSNVLYKVLNGHTDAVWQLAVAGQKLLSCSADGSVRLWDVNLHQPLLSTFNNEGIPISIDWLMRDTNQFVVTYDTLKTFIYDTETGQIVRQFANDHASFGDPNYRINRLISHPSQPIVITAHDDRKIRYFDSNSGRLIHSVVAHLESVTSLAIDPQQTCLLSGSHDRSIRLWNLDNRNCLQEITAHQKKDGESIHDVAFHSSKPYMTSVGADSIAKIYA